MSEQTEEKQSRVLVVVALGIALVGIGLGITALVKLNGMAEDDALGSSLSKRMGGDSSLRRSIADSEEVSERTRSHVEAALEDPDVLDELVARTLASGAFNQLVESKGTAAAAAFADSDAFEAAVLNAGSDAETGEDPIDELSRSLARYEQELGALARQVKDDESAIAVNDLQGQLVTLRQDISGLSDRVACAVAYRGNTPRTFLLKSNESTVLPGMDLVVSLSRLKKEVIETVSVSAQEGSLNQVHTQVIGNVKLGKPFTIDQGDTHYEGTFTFAQTRLFGKAFVGFEIRMTATDGQPCAPTQVSEESSGLLSGIR